MGSRPDLNSGSWPPSADQLPANPLELACANRLSPGPVKSQLADLLLVMDVCSRRILGVEVPGGIEVPGRQCV